MLDKPDPDLRVGPYDRRVPQYRHPNYMPRPSHGRRWYDVILHGDPNAPKPEGTLGADDGTR
jgi:hypothetical protein